MKVALIIFIIAAVTDYLDGYVARARNETSALGAALDPIADKLLVAATLVLLTKNGVISGVSVLAVLAILLREILVSGLREAVARSSGEEISVTALAKGKTMLQLVSVGLFLATAPGGLLVSVSFFKFAAIISLWCAAGLTIWTGSDYVKTAAAKLAGYSPSKG